MSVVTKPDLYTADERGAWALAGVFKVVASIFAGVSLLGGAFMALDNQGLDPIERALVFLVYAVPGLFIAALVLFLGYVLVLLVGIHHRLRQAG